MWGSVLGGLIGAVVGALAGGAVTYYRERRLERERRHREAAKEVFDRLFQLEAMFEEIKLKPLFGSDITAVEIARFAKKTELVATRLSDSDLKRRVLRAMQKPYESWHGVKETIKELRLDLMEEAYPDLYEVHKTQAENYNQFLDDRIEDEDIEGAGDPWRGPATSQFVNRIEETFERKQD